MQKLGMQKPRPAKTQALATLRMMLEATDKMPNRQRMLHTWEKVG